jgi:hypothetical protein
MRFVAVCLRRICGTFGAREDPLVLSCSRQLDRCDFGDAGSRDEGAGAHPQPSPIPMRFAGMPSAGSPALVRPTQFLQHKGARLGRMLTRAISFTPSSGGRAPLGLVGSLPDRRRGVQPPRCAPVRVSSSVNGGLVARCDPPQGLIVLASRIQKGAARACRGLRVR